MKSRQSAQSTALLKDVLYCQPSAGRRTMPHDGSAKSDRRKSRLLYNGGSKNITAPVVDLTFEENDTAASSSWRSQCHNGILAPVEIITDDDDDFEKMTTSKQYAERISPVHDRNVTSGLHNDHETSPPTTSRNSGYSTPPNGTNGRDDDDDDVVYLGGN